MSSPASRLAAVALLGFALAGCAGLFESGLGSKNLTATAGKVDAITASEMISAYRRTYGLTGVAIDPTLERVAQNQALAMAHADKMSHTVQGGLMSRLDGAGVQHSAAVENVSAGYYTLAEAVSGWRHSPPHNTNLLNPKMRRMGIASANVPDSKFKIYWALVMTD